MKIKNRVISIILGVFASLVLVYLLSSLYFINNFYIGTKIDGINATGKSVQRINNILLNKVNSYEIEFLGREDKEEEILASEIDLKYDFNNELKEIKKEQKPFLWISGFFKNKEYNLDSACVYNDDKLRETIATLAYFDTTNIQEPQNAKIIFNNGQYEISEEVYGNKIDKDKLYNSTKDAIINIEKTVNIEDENCYENPIYTSESKELIQAKDTLNKYVATKINYTIEDKAEALDGSVINEWLKLDEKFNITIDEEKVNSYIDFIAEKYNYKNESADYSMANGNILNVTVTSDIGYIDKTVEVNALLAAIKDGKEINRTIELKKENNTSTSNTFVEVNLTEQKIWFFKNGELITSGEVVTGNESKGMSTPPGIFTLNDKQRYAILRGVDYAVPVDYWMPFNGGIGLHDAKWRSTFGGEYYKTEGSHGCVNTPYDVVKTIYNNINVGTYVICHY